MAQADEARVALVTGASSGFGLLGSIELAKEGFRVFATLRNPERRPIIEVAAKNHGVELDVVQLDVTDPPSIEAAVRQVLDAAGHIDVLVNNAGFGLGGYFEDVSDDELRRQFDTNFFGLAAVTRAVLPSMRERRRGRVINISSISGRVAVPGLSAYVASKWAVEGLSEALRLELGTFGIEVVIIEPGTFKTDIFTRNKQLAAHAQDPHSPYYAMSERLSRFVDRMVEKRGGDPREVGRMIARAATATKPRLRYVVGSDASMQAWAKRLLPDSALEAMTLRVLRRIYGRQ